MAASTGGYSGHKLPSQQITAVLATLARAHTSTPVSQAYMTNYPVWLDLLRLAATNSY